MTILPKETIKVIAQSIGINNLPDEVAATLAPDVEYRMREIMQEAIKCMIHSKRTILTTDDVNSALQLRNIEPLYGFASGGPLRFKRALGHSDLFYIDDGEVELKEVMESPLPKAPLDTAVVAHWLAIEGVQPAIPENVPLETPVPFMETRKADAVVPKKRDDDLPIEVKLPVKHVLSQELQIYFEKITELTISSSNSDLFKAALNSLATDSGLHPLVPYFTRFIMDEVTQGLDDLQLLFALMRLVRSLLVNPHVQMDLYLHQLMPSVITCLVAKRLGGKLSEGHWELRDYVANLIAFICKRYGHLYHSLQPRVTRTLLHALEPNRAMTQHYGGIKGLSALGPRAITLLNVEAYLELLTPELSLETQKNEMKRYEAMRVYGALLKAVGLFMITRLNSCPAFLSKRTWNPRGRGKIVTTNKKEGFSMVSTLSSQSQCSPNKAIGDEDNGPTAMDTAESLSQNGSVISSISVNEGQTQEKQSNVGNDSKQDLTNQNRSRIPLSDYLKEDASPGPLLASLFELFGEGVLPFVPSSELSIFI